MNNLITILTATYNRAHLLTDLYDSLCRQTCKEFEWLIVDDGSTDGTRDLVERWQDLSHFKYIYKENGGKNRAINEGVKHVTTPFVCIVDSDDYLTDDAVAFLSCACNEILNDKQICGVVGLRGLDENTPLKQVSFSTQFVEVNNLQRRHLQLDADACEVYRTEILRTHPFEVWPNEKFVPEEIVWNQIALEGYCLRWYNKVTCIVRYQNEGLTKCSWELLRTNPMGYAMMYNQRLLLDQSFWGLTVNVLQMISCCYLGHSSLYILKSNNVFLSILLYIPGCFLGCRRQHQLKQYCVD